MRKKTVIILCPHRSGSSAVAGMFHHMGVHMGDKFVGPSEANPRGHFEDYDFVEFGEKYLKIRGGAWNVPPPDDFLDHPEPLELAEFDNLVEKRSEHKFWGWKDPRTVLYIKNFYHLVPNPFIVWMIRSEEACTKSLIARGNGQGDSEPILETYKDLWRRHQHRFYDFFFSLADVSHTAIHYDGLVENPEAWLNWISRTFGLPITPEAKSFIDPTMRHYQ